MKVGFVTAFCHFYVACWTVTTDYRLNCDLSTTSYFGAYFVSSKMAKRQFEIKLIPEFSDTSGQPVVEWTENVELVCELSKITKIKQILPLHLEGGTLAVYRQVSKEQESDIERVLLTAFRTNQFTAYDQFQTWRLWPGKTVDVFLAELKKLAILIAPLL